MDKSNIWFIIKVILVLLIFGYIVAVTFPYWQGFAGEFFSVVNAKA